MKQLSDKLFIKLSCSSKWNCDFCTCFSHIVQSLGLVSPGAATGGVNLFYLEKAADRSLVIALWSDDLFLLSSLRHSHLPTSFIQCSF